MSSGFGVNSAPKATSDAYRNSSFWDKKEDELGVPDGAQYLVKEVYYKVGHHGFVYMWLTDSWIRSTKKAEFFKKVNRL